jgi:predicted Rossmann fold flavoprotein
MSNNNFDLVIVGGGAAGIMAAISAKRHHPELRVVLLDRTFALGRKILICGAGRCNITNVNLNASVAKHYYGASTEFIQAVFSQFDYERIVEFFNELGVELYVERKTDIGKLFPVTDQARTITSMLEDELSRLGVEVRLLTEVQAITKQGEGFAINTNTLAKTGERLAAETINAAKLILSAGGKTYPALGSNGSGYDLARSLGHSLIQPVPSALPLESKNQLSHFLQGVRLDFEVTSIIAGNPVKTRTDEVMFTKYGFSGPAVLNVSREISIRLNREQRQDVELQLNFFPGKNKAEVTELLKQRWAKRPEQALAKSLYGLFPNKVAELIPNLVELSPELVVGRLQPQQIERLAGLLTETRVPIHATRGWNEAEFTAGGVATSEVELGKLESRLQKNLYFCGEILDVDGDVGGFNLSWAWASGFVAGQLLS